MRQCNHCPETWALSTSTGTVIKHLQLKHSIVEGGEPTARKSRQTTLTESVPAKIVALNDAAIVRYVIGRSEPHTVSEDRAFRRLVSTLCPGFQPKSARTVKRSILKLYFVLRNMLVQYFGTLLSKISLTFDGWSSPKLQGLYPVTAHWIDSSLGLLLSCVIDFPYIEPGTGVGKRVGTALSERLSDLGIDDKILAVVNDNGSDAIAAAEYLSNVKTPYPADVLSTKAISFDARSHPGSGESSSRWHEPRPIWSHSYPHRERSTVVRVDLRTTTRAGYEPIGHL